MPLGHWKTLTLVAGPRCDGIVAPCLFDRPINAVSFLAWVVQFLVPILRPGDIVVMDNLSSHKAAAVRRAIRGAGAKPFFLPAYSPDLNPIEQAFSQLKTLLRKENARTLEQTSTCIGRLFNLNLPRCARQQRLLLPVPRRTLGVDVSAGGCSWPEVCVAVHPGNRAPHAAHQSWQLRLRKQTGLRQAALNAAGVPACARCTSPPP